MMGVMGGIVRHDLYSLRMSLNKRSSFQAWCQPMENRQANWSKFRIPAAAVQVPVGIEDKFKGVVDVVHWRSIYNRGQKG
jgi:hypothetical protein